MLTRILTAAVGSALFLAILFAPPVILYVTLFLVAAIMLFETYSVIDTKRELQIVGFLAQIIMFAGAFTEKIGLAFYGSIFLFMVALVFLWGKCNSKEVLTAGMATIFIVSSILTLVLIRLRYDQYMFFLPFVIAWLSDTGAYFTGYFFGKHKLVPKMSPKKTVEGAIGGIIFAIIFVCVFGWLYSGNADIMYFVKCGIVGLIGSVISQVGDLVASCIKRDFNKKDYGSLLPGHGGLMDRFDSVLLAAPYALFVVSYFGI